MSISATLFRCGPAIALALCCTRAQSAPPSQPQAVPRYVLQAGMELEYKQQGSFDYDGEKYNQAMSWHVYVTSQNANGSFDCLITVSSSNWQGEKQPNEEPAAPQVARLSLFPDGRVAGDALARLTTDIRTIYPRLPASAAELRGGWQSSDPELGESVKYRSAGMSDQGTLKIEAENTGLLSEINGRKSTSSIDFDTKKKLVVHVEVKTESEKLKANSVTELAGSTMHDRAFAEQLRADMQVYFRANKAYRELDERITEQPEKVDALIDQARTALATAKGKLKSEILPARLEADLGNLEEMASYYRESAKGVAEILGKPAPEWKAKDLDGKEHSWVDYRGKIVVLDFWFRGCSWCIRAMPQLKQIAEQYKGRPVAVLGMNTDSELTDARYVVEKMKLPYTNLQAEELTKDFRVSGFPTLMIVDPQGVIRHIHSGFSPDLKQRLAAQIDSLLAQQERTAHFHVRESAVEQAAAVATDEPAPRALTAARTGSEKRTVRFRNPVEIQLKIEHLSAAAEHLSQAGLAKEARRLKNVATGLRKQLRESQAEQARHINENGSDQQADTTQLAREVRQLRAEVQHLRAMVAQLASAEQREHVQHAIGEESEPEPFDAEEPADDLRRREILPHQRDRNRRNRQTLLNDLDRPFEQPSDEEMSVPDHFAPGEPIGEALLPSEVDSDLKRPEPGALRNLDQDDE